MNPIRNLFDSINLDMIHQFVAERRQENLHLEFKQLGDGADLTKDDRKNFAKAVSGFANSEGGIIVWGVEGRPDDEKVDAASELKPVTNARAVISRLEALTGEASSPPVVGVVHKPIFLEGDSGFAASLVPESESPPHMAKLGVNEYFIRSGASFRAMEHFQIADMFGRRRRPKLIVTARMTDSGTIAGAGPEVALIHFVLGLRNDGRGIAKWPSLRINLPPGVKPRPPHVSASSLEKLRKDSLMPGGSGRYRCAGSADDVIHVGVEVDVASLSYDYPLTSAPRADLIIPYQVSAEAMATRDGTVTINGADLADFVARNRK